MIVSDSDESFGGARSDFDTPNFFQSLGQDPAALALGWNLPLHARLPKED